MTTFPPEPDDEGQVIWDAFIDRLGRYTVEAEQHLQIDAGTIGDLLKESSDFSFVIRLWGVLEPILRDAVAARIERNLKRDAVPNEGLRAIVKLVSEQSIDQIGSILGKLENFDQRPRDFIGAIHNIRNKYVHHIRNSKLGLWDMCGKIDPKTPSKVASKLTGGIPITGTIDVGFLRSLTFYEFASVLGQCLQIVSPPPPPQFLISGLGHYPGILGATENKLDAGFRPNYD